MTHSDIAAPSSRLARPRRSRVGRWLRIALWCAAAVVVLLAVAAGIGLMGLRAAAKAALPQLDGDLHAAGLSAPVTVRRDAHGVPHIDAASEQDLFFAQGYVTAQDRLWQMDAYRRNAQGTLAEVLGPSLVKHDIAQRVLGLRRVAERVYAHLPAGERARMDAYSRGVNAFIAAHPGTLPPEFTLLHYKPQPWTSVDSLSIGMSMVQTLDTHWDVKLAREQIAARLHNAKLEADLYPVGSWRDRPPTGEVLDLSQPHPEPPVTDDDDSDDDRTQTKLNGAPLPAPQYDLRAARAAMGLPACDGCAPGSNEWVIAGAHTASGKPLLSNDMHLDLSVPNIWYMADLSAPGYHAAGVTMVGVPYVIAGHNEHVAWGITALYADTQDLYVEKLDGKGNYLAAGGAWKPLGIDHETIGVRGGNDVTVDVKSTAHGPLLNPMLPKETRPLALSWTLYDGTLNALPVYALNKAANWTDFSQALGTWCWPTLSIVYSDDQNHIAYHAVGKVPQRPAGLAATPIYDQSHAWQGYIPFDQMPNAFDPPAGFLATANSRVTSEKFPAPLTLEWAEPYRAERIYKSLQGRDQLKPADMLALETDIYSEMDQEMAHRFAYAIDHAAGADARLKTAADLMRSWDGRLSTDSAAASLVTRTREALWPLILDPKLGDLAHEYNWSESAFAEEEIVMHNNPAWLPKGYKDWDALLTEAVRRGMRSGHAPADISKWAYGDWHVVDLEHPLAHFLPFLRGVAGTGAQPLSGDKVTVKEVGRAFGPSQRFTMDWSNIDGSTENIVLGESGNPLSPYFRDQWDDYYNGRTFALPFTPAAVAAQTSHTLRLLP
ncbi:MAG TPA: penicillin acylase family protein [Terracidiphilus sp.]|nr:penicillin acylase family protein [Terracidiphilus sp.]